MLTSAVPTLPLANYLYPFLPLQLFFYKHIYKYKYIYSPAASFYLFFICAATFDNVNRIEHSRKPEAATISLSARAHFLWL